MTAAEKLGRARLTVKEAEKAAEHAMKALREAALDANAAVVGWELGERAGDLVKLAELLHGMTAGLGMALKSYEQPKRRRITL
jgi:hypothetical protein